MADFNGGYSYGGMDTWAAYLQPATGAYAYQAGWHGPKLGSTNRLFLDGHLATFSISDPVITTGYYFLLLK